MHYSKNERLYEIEKMMRGIPNFRERGHGSLVLQTDMRDCIEEQPPPSSYAEALQITMSAIRYQPLDDRLREYIAEREMDYTDRVVVINPHRLKDEYKTPEDQLFLANGGFGCHPNSRGRKVYGEFLKDGEGTFYQRADIIGVLKDEYMPDWAKEKLQQKYQQESAQTDGMTMQ